MGLPHVVHVVREVLFIVQVLIFDIILRQCEVNKWRISFKKENKKERKERKKKQEKCREWTVLITGYKRERCKVTLEVLPV